LNLEDTLLLSFYRIASFLLGALLLFMGAFFSFLGSTILLAIPALALVLTGVTLRPNSNKATHRFGVIASLIGIVSYALFLFLSIGPEETVKEISLFEVGVFIALLLSALLHQKLPT